MPYDKWKEDVIKTRIMELSKEMGDLQTTSKKQKAFLNEAMKTYLLENLDEIT